MRSSGSKLDLSFVDELKQYGEFDIRGCFNCGHCTAVCPLVQRGESYPRRLVRYAQLGFREHLAAAKEVWSCYYCGECSKKCPRQATPGELMECARRYFITHWDLTTLSRRFYTSRVFTAVFMGVLAVILTLLFLGSCGRLQSEHLALFEFIDVAWLHYTGIAVLVLVGLTLAANVGNMACHLTRNLPKPPRLGFIFLIKDAWLGTRDTLEEIGVQRRFKECQDEASEAEMPWVLSRRVVHMTIMWGFLGLLGATTLDLLFKEPGSYVPLYYPARLLGTLSGIALFYGTSVALWFRMERRGGPSFERSLLSDWLLLWMLWATTVTGFILEVAVYLPQGTMLGYAIFLVHVVLALELLLLLPFTKFSHAIYRPLALWIHAFWLRRSTRRNLRAMWTSRWHARSSTT
jgi:nitrate reductase gamma subunit/ferredoxin